MKNEISPEIQFMLFVIGSMLTLVIGIIQITHYVEIEEKTRYINSKQFIVDTEKFVKNFNDNYINNKNNFHYKNFYTNIFSTLNEENIKLIKNKEQKDKLLSLFKEKDIQNVKHVLNDICSPEKRDYNTMKTNKYEFEAASLIYMNFVNDLFIKNNSYKECLSFKKKHIHRESILSNER